MSKRIAPTLRRLTGYPLQRGTWFPPGTTNGDCVQAERELRALLAVARAAWRFGTDPDLFDMPSVEDVREIIVAVARLDKVSGKGEP